MSCKCKNIIENFQGGTIPLDTIFNGNVQICGPGKSLNVSQIDGCSPTTIGSQSGCTSATTTVLIVSGKTNFSCDINVAHGGMFSGGTNLMDIFTTVPGTDINVTGGTYSNTTGCATFTTNQGDNFDICGFMTGFTNNFITGGTFNSSVGVLTLLNNNGNTFDISGFTTNPIPTFTGNTSATCINELWVSNISGCSPVTIGTELITEAGLKTDFIRYNSSADTMFIGSDNTSDTRIELRKSVGELKIWGDGDVNLYSQDDSAKIRMSDVISLEAQEHTFLDTSPDVRLKRTVASADTSLSFVSPANVSSTKLYYKGVDSSFRIDTFNGITSEEALKIDFNQNVELSSNLKVSGNTNIVGDLSTRDITANDIILDTITPDKPSITLKRASVTGAELELGFGGNDNGILKLHNFTGGTDILLQGGGISYFPQSLKIGVPYVYPESNPATLTVGGDILTSGNTNTLGTISSGGTNLDQLFAPISSSGGGGGGTFTGNTSATCINELWVSNISGCSPVIIGTEAEFSQDVLVSQYIKHKGDENTFINFTDNRIRFNAGGINFLDLEEDGSAPYPLTVNNGGNKINFRVQDRNSDLLLKTDSEASKVNLYHAGNMMLETAIDGINVMGNINQTGETSTFSNGYYTQISTGFANTGQLTFNANHDGGVTANTYTPTFAGDVNAGMTVVKMPSGGHGGLDFYVKKHGTTGGSQDLSTFTKILSLNQNGNTSFGGKILLGDGDVSNNYAGFGDNDDLKIFHNGAHSIIRETGTGNLYLQSDNSVILSKDNSTEPMVKGIADGAVELYYDNIKKFETTTDGAKVSGTLNLTGTTFISGTTGNTVSTLGIDNNGNVVEQKKVVTVTLGPTELIGSVAGTNYLPPITVPPNKYAKVVVHSIFTYNGTQYDGGLVFGLNGPSNTWTALSTGFSNSISESTQFIFKNPPSITNPQFGIWHSVGTAPTVGDGIIKFRLEYEFFDI